MVIRAIDIILSYQLGEMVTAEISDFRVPLSVIRFIVTRLEIILMAVSWINFEPVMRTK